MRSTVGPGELLVRRSGRSRASLQNCDANRHPRARSAAAGRSGSRSGAGARSSTARSRPLGARDRAPPCGGGVIEALLTPRASARAPGERSEAEGRGSGLSRRRAARSSITTGSTSGTSSRCNLIVSTTPQQPGHERGHHARLLAPVHRVATSHPRAPTRHVGSIRAFDPCLSRATHALGKIPARRRDRRRGRRARERFVRRRRTLVTAPSSSGIGNYCGDDAPGRSSSASVRRWRTRSPTATSRCSPTSAQVEHASICSA